MGDLCNTSDEANSGSSLDRPRFLAAGIAFAAAPLLARAEGSTSGGQKDHSIGKSPIGVSGYAAAKRTAGQLP
jgi:hypothetical protein